MKDQANNTEAESALGKFKARFFRRTPGSSKGDINFRALKIAGLVCGIVFIAVVMLMPDDRIVEFSERIESEPPKMQPRPDAGANEETKASRLWAAPSERHSFESASEINHNSSMVIGQKLGNARTQFRAGERWSLRVVDKFIVSQDPVPILAELVLPVETQSGALLPAGSRLYGEARFEKRSDRALVRFLQLSLPDGQIRPLAAMALGSDGQPGISGRVFSDGARNTAGQVITTFVGGLAAGSVETDALGRTKGGIENGLLTAVAATAKDRAQAYGERLKAEREWIEVSAGEECEALLNQPFGMQPAGDE